MIKSLEIRNIQSHRHSVLEFSSGLNCIVGPSDSGKSTIIRSIRKLRWNKPVGNAFRSNWGGRSLIRIITTEGNSVTFSEADERKYILNNLPDFKAFGTSVPEEIVKALDLDEINLQQQHDSIFLIGSNTSAGEVAQHFNRIAKLDRIDQGTTNTRSWMLKINNVIASKEADLEREQKALTVYEGLDRCEMHLEVLEELERDRNTMSKNRATLLGILEQYATVENNIVSYRPLMELEMPLTRVFEKIRDKNDRQIRRNKLQLVVRSIDGVMSDIEKDNEIISIAPEIQANLERITILRDHTSKAVDLLELIENISSVEKKIGKENELISTGPPINSLLILYNKKTEYEKLRSKLFSVVSELENTEKRITQAQTYYDTTHKEFEDNVGEICFFCEKPFKQ